MSKVLVIEDHVGTAISIQDTLEFEKFEVEVVHDGAEGLEFLSRYAYDVVILDIELPGVGGFEICSRFRSRGGTTPILMLTGNSMTEDKVTGLELGADDYIVKPFDRRELVARVKALLRRGVAPPVEKIAVGDLMIDLAAKRVAKQDTELKLQPMEFAILEFFVRRPNVVYTVEDLLDSVWTAENGSIESVRTCLSRLRRKIDSPAKPSIIETVHGAGYRVTAEIKRI